MYTSCTVGIGRPYGSSGALGSADKSEPDCEGEEEEEEEEEEGARRQADDQLRIHAAKTLLM
jgi:hypothetical protein